jgi:hypothetical protein
MKVFSDNGSAIGILSFMVIDRENGERETLLSVENTYLHL